ncbi:helix-turn-helix domain-containing protein [Burkholderia ubonensis]|uniref:helix-turn-helix domain-containing protein n=1 Tax=Burkholderia ubonensis TaxID=101571 RepID=UPI000AB9AB5B|nr:helix-turn-helix domain-containing protein [Burkholderia ubonensis]
MKPYTWRQAIIRSSLPSTTRHVLLTLACHINDAGESAYPSIDLLAFETGLSRRAVITHLQSAAGLGWIRTDKHGYGGQRWARNEYEPCIPDGFIQIEPPKRRTLQGGEPDDKKAVNDVHQLFEKAVNDVPEGGEPDDKKAVNDVHQLFEKAVNDVPEGGEPDDKKAVNDVHSNRPLELSIEQTTLSSAKAGRKKKSKDADDPVFEEAWRLYPKRDGDNPKAPALKAWRARIREGVDPQRLLAATKSYATARRAEGSGRSRFVMHASTFYGPNLRYAEYAPRDDGGPGLAFGADELDGGATPMRDPSLRRLAF